MPLPASKLSADKAFVVLVVVVTVAFLVILWPFHAAIFWAAVLAIVFGPAHRRLQHALRDRRSLAAFVTTMLIVFMVILPAVVVAAMLVQEAGGLYQRVQSGEIDVGRMLQRLFASMPAWAAGMLDGAGLGDLDGLRDSVSTEFAKGAKVVAQQAISFGQNTFDFVVGFFLMLYLLFFFLRDGRALAARIDAAIPLEEELRARLGRRFIAVVRATVKGNIVVAIIQGALGGLAFWYLEMRAPVLWGVLMALLSLLPAVGCAIVWLPVSAWLFATGAIWAGAGLAAYGVFVIGLVDNVVRPLLVGKDTRMPDYVVLVTTLGGMALFGLNGFVIGPLVAAMFMAVWDTVATARGVRPAVAAR